MNVSLIRTIEDWTSDILVDVRRCLEGMKSPKGWRWWKTKRSWKNAETTP